MEVKASDKQLNKLISKTVHEYVNQEMKFNDYKEIQTLLINMLE
jgi:hypothetical protein